MPIDQVVSTIKGLQPGTALLAFSYSRDMSGKVFTHSELTTLLGKNSAVPVYGTKVERLGYGIIGGNMLEGVSHGSQGAAIAVRILRGEQASAIPVITEPKSNTMFDYNILKKFRIKLESLPPDSKIINRPQGFYSQHALVINIAAGIILLLGGSLAFVIVANRRRIAAEEALVKAERGRAELLEAANREMESFCYAVSHDLQTPLRHIHSFCSIIGEEYGTQLDQAGNHYLDRVMAATEKMSQLIRDLLMLSRVASGELVRQHFDLGKMAAEIIEELKQHDSDRTVTVTIDSDLGTNADMKLVRVLLDNLLSNAWKYTSKKTEARIHLGYRIVNGTREYFISDNGAGFDMTYLDKLFVPFQRLHSSSEFEGTGIGLATVQRIISRHGGYIHAEATPGEGATFRFTLRP
jgi:signal transduction histidine kinase